MAVVEREDRGHIAILRINRPEAKNAISPEVSQEMEAHLDSIESDPEIRTVIVTGTGDVFCAGADLKVIASGRAGEKSRAGMVGAGAAAIDKTSGASFAARRTYADLSRV